MDRQSLASRRKLHHQIELSLGLWTLVIMIAVVAPGARAKHLWHMVGPGSAAYRECYRGLEQSGDFDLVDVRMGGEAESDGYWPIFFDVTRPTEGDRTDTHFCRSDGKSPARNENAPTEADAR